MNKTNSPLTSEIIASTYPPPSHPHPPTQFKVSAPTTNPDDPPQPARKVYFILVISLMTSLKKIGTKLQLMCGQAPVITGLQID